MRLSQQQAACKLNVFQHLLGRMLQSWQDTENASLANESSDHKSIRVSKEDEVEQSLTHWFTKMKKKYTRVTGLLLRLKAEELVKIMSKNDFVVTEGLVSKKCEKLCVTTRVAISYCTLPCVFNADETGHYYRTLPLARGTKNSK